MQLRRSHCLYHSSEVITNFCRDKQCLMPLCPTCIREHTHYHQELHTKPQYYNIHETVLQVRDMISTAIARLEQARRQNSHLNVKIQTWKTLLAQQIHSTKTSLHQLIDEEFAAVEAEVQVQFAQLHEERGMFSAQQTQAMEKKLEGTLEELCGLFDSLKTDRYLGSVIIYLQSKQGEVQAMQAKVGGFLMANQNYNPTLELNSGFQKQFTASLHKIFRILPPPTHTQALQRSPHANPRSPIAAKRTQIDSKWEKIERSYTPERSGAYLRSGAESSRAGGSNNSGYRQERSGSSFSFEGGVSQREKGRG